MLSTYRYSTAMIAPKQMPSQTFEARKALETGAWTRRLSAAAGDSRRGWWTTAFGHGCAGTRSHLLRPSTVGILGPVGTRHAPDRRLTREWKHYPALERHVLNGADAGSRGPTDGLFQRHWDTRSYLTRTWPYCVRSRPARAIRAARGAQAGADRLPSPGAGMRRAIAISLRCSRTHVPCDLPQRGGAAE